MFVDRAVCIDWEAWSPCSSSCTDGIRTRGCKDNPGNATGTEICNIAPQGKLRFKNRIFILYLVKNKIYLHVGIPNFSIQKR